MWPTSTVQAESYVRRALASQARDGSQLPSEDAGEDAFLSNSASPHADSQPGASLQLSPSALDMNLRGGHPPTSSRLVQMLHVPAHPLEMNAETGRGFVLPSPTNNVSLLNFPFASPDINEPGSPLGYDLNSSLLEQNLENFSNSLLDINESADTPELHFSPSSDLNLSPQESPCFTLFTGPALELGLPYNPDPPERGDSAAREESSLAAENAGRPQEASVPAPPLSSSERPRESYADLSMDSIVQQKREGVFWAAWFFFSHFFEPVFAPETEDLNISLEDAQANASAKQIDRQVFLVQNDMENMYMWYLSARPVNALGRMQLQSFISGRHQPNQAPFPFRAASGFVRSHKLQRKKYKGLSNPQCIHGLRVVESPSFSHVSEDERKRFEELTSRPLNTQLFPEAADYNAWRKVPDRSSENALQPEPISPAEPLSQVIEFLPGQSASQHPAAANTDPQECRSGGRASKRRKKGGVAKAGVNEAAGALARSPQLQGTPSFEELGKQTHAPSLKFSAPGESGAKAHTLLEQPPKKTSVGLSAVPVTDLTLQWQAEIERDRALLWGSDVPHLPASRATSARQTPLHRNSLGIAGGNSLEGASRLGIEAPLRRMQSRGLDSAAQNGDGATSQRVQGFGGLVNGFPPAPEAGFQQRTGRDRAFRSKYAAQTAALIESLPVGSAHHESGRAAHKGQQEGEPLLVETVSEEHLPFERSPDAEESAASEQRPPIASQQPQAPANTVMPPGAVLRHRKPHFDTHHGLRTEAVYEDEKGYLVFLPLPFTELKQVRVSWRNVGETGIVKVVRQQPSDEIVRGDRTLRLVTWGSGGQEAPREIFLPTRIPDDALLEAQYSADCAGLEISVPKHAACTEERPVRLFLPDQRQLLRGS